MTTEILRDLAARAVPARRVVDAVKRLRWALPLAIALTVVVHQAWESLAYESWSPAQRFLEGVLIYGVVGPLVTYWTLDWIARAIETREAIEARVRRGERYLASITSGSADAIFSLDTEDVVQTWNRGAEEIFGYPPGSIIGQHVGVLVPESLRRRGDLASIRDRLFADGFVRGYRTRRLTHDGREVDVELTQTLLRGEDGGIIGSSVILRDETDRIAAETAIRRLNQELEARVAERTRQLEAAGTALRANNDALVAANHELKQLDALKDEFVDLVSHELRAPLTNINASVELLLSNGMPDGARTKLEIIGHEASRLTRLVQGVLDISRIGAGRLKLLKAPADPADLCRTALMQLGAADRDWRVHIAPGTPAVMADADRVVQVLGNLLSNAVKYSPAASRIDLTVGPAPGGADVLFSVTDEGVGIPAEEVDRIFERFHRVERHDARETYGHGLGLYIARKIVEAHGGRIWVETTPGAGATFLFTLPRAPEEP